MAISSFPVNHFFLSIYLLSSVQFTYHIPLPQKENDVVLSEYIRHYEPAIYDPDKIQRQQRRLRRSAAHQHGADPVEPLRINITASHRVFKLVLYPETNLFSADVVFETNDNRSLQFDPGKIYQGTLEDDNSAIVDGLLTSSGLFDGTITFPASSARYYIEPTSRYLVAPGRSSYHTVVYSEDDVIKPSRETCASEELRKREAELRSGRDDLRSRRENSRNGKDDLRTRKEDLRRRDDSRRGEREERRQRDRRKRSGGARSGWGRESPSYYMTRSVKFMII